VSAEKCSLSRNPRVAEEYLGLPRE
jgi:hypothetical protein